MFLGDHRCGRCAGDANDAAKGRSEEGFHESKGRSMVVGFGILALGKERIRVKPKSGLRLSGEATLEMDSHGGAGEVSEVSLDHRVWGACGSFWVRRPEERAVLEAALWDSVLEGRGGNSSRDEAGTWETTLKIKKKI